MPDIIEENEGEGNSAIQRRVNALVLARAAAAAARAQNQNNNNNNNNNNGGNNGGRPVAVPDGNAPPGAPPAAAAAANGNAGGGGEAASVAAAAEVHQIASNLARLASVDVRPMFRRLGVRRGSDIRYIREKDLDGIPRITPIQKRKVWAILKYVSLEASGAPLTSRTTLSEIAKTLNANKKKEKESSNGSNNNASNSSNATSSTTSAIAQQQPYTARKLPPDIASGSVVPMVQVSKLDEFDGHHSNWLLWKRKTEYQLASTSLGSLLQEGEEGKSYAKKNVNHDFLLFNLAAQAICSGSARHLIQKAEQQANRTSTAPNNAASSSRNNNNNNNTSNETKKSKPSGRVLWNLLVDEYSKGPMAFWILSDARQTLQKLTLVGPSCSSSSTATATMINTMTTATANVFESNNNNDDDDDDVDNNNNRFITRSARDYVDRFRSARDTLAEYKQELPDSFLAATFVEHVYDDNKKQLLRDASTKNLSLEDCIKELLMSDHMLRVRQQNNNMVIVGGNHNNNNSNGGGGGQDFRALPLAAAGGGGGNRKRQNPDEPEDDRKYDDGKRPKMDEAAVAGEEVNDEDMMNDEPDEATS